MARFFADKFLMSQNIINRMYNVLVDGTLSYSKTIQKLVLSFRNLHEFHSNVAKTEATFWSELNFKPMTNLELSNVLAYDAKLVLSFIRQSQEISGPKRSIKITDNFTSTSATAFTA